MKTTMLLDDIIANRAKNMAKKKGMTFTAFVESALTEYLRVQSIPKEKKKLKIKPYGKGGYIDPKLEGNWAEIREIIYK
ncbi:MAG: hypothetical protein OEZ22_01545 [Spirochaetia bacterium]|nr:hypothetical protein [Spirochaetia bacterium]